MDALAPEALRVIEESGYKPQATPGPGGDGLLPGGIRADRPHELGEVRPRFQEFSPQDDLRPGWGGQRPPDVDPAAPPKPDPAYRFRLTVSAFPREGVSIEANGHPLGFAPVARDVRLLPPGDLVIVARCEGYATEVQTMRLGREPQDGVLDVHLELKLDLPAVRPGAATPDPGGEARVPTPSSAAGETPARRAPR